MTARWLLVRHGQTEAQGRYLGHADVPLSPLGHTQALRLAERLAREPLGAAFASDLCRASDTLATVLALQPAPVTPALSTDLREVSFGAWEGRTYAEVSGDPGTAAALAGTVPFPGGESLDDLAARVQRFYVHLQERAASGARHDGDAATVIVAHGGPLRLLLCLALGLPPAEHWRFQVDLASLSEVRWAAPTGARLVSLNDRCHLAAEWGAPNGVLDGARGGGRVPAGGPSREEAARP